MSTGSWDEPEPADLEILPTNCSLARWKPCSTTLTFQGQMVQRTAAMTAFVRVDSSLRLRRALLRNHLKRCHYWRRLALEDPLEDRCAQRTELGWQDVGASACSWHVSGSLQSRSLKTSLRRRGTSLHLQLRAGTHAVGRGIWTTVGTQFTDLTVQRPPSEDLSDEDMPDLATPPVEPVPEETVPQSRDLPTPSQQPREQPPPSTPPRPVPQPEREASSTSADDCRTWCRGEFA